MLPSTSRPTRLSPFVSYESWKAQLSPESFLSLCEGLTADGEEKEKKNLNFSPWKIVNKCIGERIKHQSFYIIINRAWIRQNAVNQLVSMSNLTAHASFSPTLKYSHTYFNRFCWSRESFLQKNFSRFGNRRLNFQLVTVDHQANQSNKQLTIVVLNFSSQCDT